MIKHLAPLAGEQSETATETRATNERYRGKILACCVTLLALVLVVYAQTARGVLPFWSGTPFDFIALDDPDYFSSNPTVRAGMTADGVRWGFSAFHAGNWHPLTWLSLMLDASVWGEGPGGPHLTNLLWHLANVLLLLVVLLRMTNRPWPAFLVAAFWGVHPLHAESVAWISERKDVLSTFFGLLAILAYDWYARRPGAGRYVLLIVCFLLSLLSKQMWVTLPAVLLLLDYWPLGRTRIGDRIVDTASHTPSYSQPGWTWLIVEKLPLVGLSIAFSVLIYVVQDRAGAVWDLASVPLTERVLNAIHSYGMYVAKTLWPAGLGVMYPHPPAGYGMRSLLSSGIPLALVSLIAIGGWRRWPWLFVGWFWFLGTLVPVIGLVQIGSHSWADRYSYLPQIGLLVAAIWSAAATVDWLAGRLPVKLVRITAACTATVLLLTLTVAGHRQVAHWRDTESLFNHTLAVTRHNHELEIALAGYLTGQQKFDQAAAHYRSVLSDDAENIRASLDLGAVYAQQGKLAEAVAQLYDAIKRHPNNAVAHSRLGATLLGLGQVNAALAQYQQAISLRPDWADPLNDVAWLFATHESPAVRSAEQAVSLAERAAQLTGSADPSVLDTLAAAYAEAGRWDDAAATARRAIEIAGQQGARALANDIAARESLYRRQQPFRVPSPPVVNP